MSIEAMKQALEALEEVQEFMNTSDWLNDRVTFLRQAIAEAEKQEPVAEVVLWRGEKQVQWEQSLPVGTKFYTTPQQRKPLTDDEIAEVAERMEASDPTDSFWRDFARAIEAAHGIKE